ncbi:methyltransferase domain-containing protein [Candidatus Woesearchaeota archaeon]|nr:methyltransferase domain-containing protein [Candidatus Woesearchaeota archaeon]MBW3022285.1 methyltransferase domain-containing protein [Candidatus Woesearchaeota archaeon]
MKLNLGCGKISKKGYINIDQNNFENVDRVLDIRNLDYEDNSVEEVRMNYVIEHLTYREGEKLLRTIFKILKQGGTLELSAPDLEKSCKKFLEAKERKWTYWLYNIYGAQRWPGDVHKSGYTFDFLKLILENIGFRNIKDISPTDDYHAHNFRLTANK